VTVSVANTSIIAVAGNFADDPTLQDICDATILRMVC
jgi:hypothetical protein